MGMRRLGLDMIVPYAVACAIWAFSSVVMLSQVRYPAGLFQERGALGSKLAGSLLVVIISLAFVSFLNLSLVMPNVPEPTPWTEVTHHATIIGMEDANKLIGVIVREVPFLPVTHRQVLT